MNCDPERLPIACRFGEPRHSPLSQFLLIPTITVASDQWLTTHFDSTWKISEVKQYILAKVYNRSVSDNDDQPSRNRPVSPITFASARNSFDSSFEGSLQDNHVIDLDPRLLSESTRQMRMRQLMSQRVASPSSGVPGSPTEQLPVILPPHHYPMLVFSTGQLLEDDCSLAWYRLRPHELLELHPPGTIVRLPRDVMLEYIKPYLELDVRALRVIVKDKDMHAFCPAYAAPDAPSPSKNKKPKDLAPGPGESHSPSVAGSASPASQSTRKRRKTKLEWRDRYLVIRQGMLSLFKSRTVSFQYSLLDIPELSFDCTVGGRNCRISRRFTHARSPSSLPCVDKKRSFILLLLPGRVRTSFAPSFVPRFLIPSSLSLSP